jgi:hypothetical protein
MTSSSYTQDSWSGRWKRYCGEYDAFFDRHRVTHEIYTFTSLFTVLCLFQVLGLQEHFFPRTIIGSAFVAAILTVVHASVRQRAARKRRTESQRDG